MLHSRFIKSCLIAHLIISFCYLISSRVVTHLTLFYFILSYFILFHFTFNRQHCTHATIPSSLSNPVTEQPLPSIHFYNSNPGDCGFHQTQSHVSKQRCLSPHGCKQYLGHRCNQESYEQNECDTRQSFFAHEDPQ